MIKLPVFVIANKLTIILVAVILLVGIGGFFAYQKFIATKAEQQAEEVDLNFDAEGPYALLSPRRDGNALILNLKRTASYDKITYELAYNAEGIDRGVMGEINTKDKKGEYEQEILFGTCSKNVCKYDTGVENGTLTLHIRKGNQAYRMITQWRLEQPDIALGILGSGDGHFGYKIASNTADLSITKYVISHDLTGAPKLPDNKNVFGKVYAINIPSAKVLSAGQVTIELANTPPTGAKIARFDLGSGNWKEYETKIDGSKLTINADGEGIFAVLSETK